MVGSHGPEAISASPEPGHGGIVAPIADRDSSPLARNWNAVPSGIVMQTPLDTATTSSSSPDFRHISPRPDRKYQISSTERCRIATDVCRAANSKWARPPPPTCRRMRTSDPSGATASRFGGNGFVWNARSTLLQKRRGRRVNRGLACSFAERHKSTAAISSWSGLTVGAGTRGRPTIPSGGEGPRASGNAALLLPRAATISPGDSTLLLRVCSSHAGDGDAAVERYRSRTQPAMSDSPCGRPGTV
jgi:hypothetical protein